MRPVDSVPARSFRPCLLLLSLWPLSLRRQQRGSYRKPPVVPLEITRIYANFGLINSETSQGRGAVRRINRGGTFLPRYNTTGRAFQSFLGTTCEMSSSHTGRLGPGHGFLCDMGLYCLKWRFVSLSLVCLRWHNRVRFQNQHRVHQKTGPGAPWGGIPYNRADGPHIIHVRAAWWFPVHSSVMSHHKWHVLLPVTSVTQTPSYSLISPTPRTTLALQNDRTLSHPCFRHRFMRRRAVGEPTTRRRRASSQLASSSRRGATVPYRSRCT